MIEAKQHVLLIEVRLLMWCVANCVENSQTESVLVREYVVIANLL